MKLKTWQNGDCSIMQVDTNAIRYYGSTALLTRAKSDGATEYVLYGYDSHSTLLAFMILRDGRRQTIEGQ